MNTPPRSALKSRPSTHDRPRAAALSAVPPGVGAPKGVAEGVPSALRPDPQLGDGRYPIAWLHIAVPMGAVPTATSKCACGWDRSAIGRQKVRDLIDLHAVHRDACPLRNSEGRKAA
jgi:hypothetical protein